MMRTFLKSIFFLLFAAGLSVGNTQEIPQSPMEECLELLAQTLPPDFFKKKEVIPFKYSKEERIVQSSELFFDALVATDIKEAKKYTTNYGLGTLLYFDFDDLDKYEVVNCNVQGRTARVDVNFNNMSKEVRCLFQRKDTLWHFQGLDTYRLFIENGTLPKFGHKVAP